MNKEQLELLKQKKDKIKLSLKDKKKDKLTQKEINALVIQLAELLNLIE